jgi:hypothetical protein
MKAYRQTFTPFEILSALAPGAVPQVVVPHGAFCWGKLFVALVVLLLGNTCGAQPDTALEQKAVVHFSGFMDVYYAYDFNRPQAGIRQPFFITITGTRSATLILALLGQQ